MYRLRTLAARAGVFLPMQQAAAQGICGPRIFVSTLTIDDPAVADEASLPTFAWTRDGVEDGRGPTHNYDFDFEFAKRITSNFGLSLGTGFSVADVAHDKTRFGWHNLDLTAKYAACVDEAHEFMLAAGVTREFGRTGTTHLDAAAYGATTPTLYFGKGFGDLPVDWLRPVAITGAFGYSVSDKGLKAMPNSASGFNLGAENRWQGGLSLQYSLPYLQSQVRDVGLPEWIGKLTPLMELSWSSPATAPSGLGTQFMLAPGVVYAGGWYQLGIEALVPLNRATGRNVGALVFAAAIAPVSTFGAAPIGVSLAGMALALQPWFSHAGAAGDVWLSVASALHLLAAGVWLGGLPPVLLVLRAVPVARAGVPVHRFGALAAGAVAVLAASSIWLGLVFGGGVSGLVGTEYGLVALTKLALAVWSWLFLTLALAAGTDTRGKLTGSVAAETMLGLAAVGLAACLAMLLPGAHQQPLWPFPWRLSLVALEEPELHDEIPGALLLTCSAAGGWRCWA